MPHRLNPDTAAKAGPGSGGGKVSTPGMNVATAHRRQSVAPDHGHAGGVGGAATTTTGSTNIHLHSGGGSIHGGNRAALIMTSAQGRRVSNAHGHGHIVSAVSKNYENSYKTEPDKPFSIGAAKRLMRETMESMLQGQRYDKDACKKLTVTLADAIKKRVKDLGFLRYKIVTNVAIGQANDTSLAVASRCVWNVTHDSFAEYTFKNDSLFAVGLVYAVYSD